MTQVHITGVLGVVQLPTRLTNDFEVQGGEEIIVYRGEAFRLWFDGVNIRGNASITRIMRKKTTVSIARRPCWWMPWKREIVGTKERVSDTVVWRIKADSGCGDPDFGVKYFIHWGRPCIERDTASRYRGALVGVAANAGFIFPDTLLDNIFDPIDQELMRIHRLVANA